MLDLGVDGGGQIGEAALQPGLESWDAVVFHQADLVEDLDGAFDAESIGAQHREQLGVADLVTVGGAEQDDQAAVDIAEHSAGPAACLADGLGGIACPDQPGVGRVPAPVEAAEVSADLDRRDQRAGGEEDRTRSAVSYRGPVADVVAFHAGQDREHDFGEVVRALQLPGVELQIDIGDVSSLVLMRTWCDQSSLSRVIGRS
ncbi:hypothetical protein [Nonomuraea sp. 10N515B]|uniref:hypothetical protein n=1 Tax=Nonomuraea sp. 10N515B TaxID=3457422 RepID=UPI003FCE9015